MDKAEFDEFVLTNMPSFIAINYQRLLETQKPQEQVALILHIYNLGFHALTINLVSQYVFRDRGKVDHPELNKLLERKFLHSLTTDAWQELFFTALRAYEGMQDLLFMPELYDFYWDTSTYPHRRRDEVKPPFDRLTQATVEILKKQLVPHDESGWHALAEELQEHLQHILQSLSFIGKYDLIHVLDQDEFSYTFELQKGTHITIGHRPLPQSTQLIPGWFYLRTETEDFLRLDPWLVFWEETGEGINLLPTDTGVFDRIIYERQLQYLLTTPGQTRMDDKHISEFVHVIMDAIEEAKRKRQEAEKLTWGHLCSISEEISKQRMTTVLGKYHQELYLQRDTVRQHFEAFLADPQKRGFVLVGKSGVGKSNFLFSLAEELQSRSNVCVLMYDGANLPVASSSLTEIISQDFSDRVFLSRQPVQQVWQEVARIEGIDERQVVLCVDAINENSQATELLRQLNAMVQGPWSWLKVVLSCRPETWKEIKRRVKLAEVLYYREQEGGVWSVELEPFTYSEQMEPFTRQELPEVYSKYQHVFDLRTPYEALSYEMRQTFRDPLNLWLLASTYHRQTIPTHVKFSELIEEYAKKLLQQEDLRFLENQLIPLMVKEGHFSNVITEADLDLAGGAIYEFIYSNQVLSDGRRMNESFLRLCDAGILVQQEQGLKQQFAFKYERFYEYFVGKRITSLSETLRDRHTFYLDLIEESALSPFLWGAIRNALVEEAMKPGSETILKLCRTAHQRVKEMMVNVLITLGLNNLQPVNDLLDKLLPAYKQPGEWRKGQQLLGKANTTLDIVSQNAGTIAIEVASMLDLLPILLRAAQQADPTLRTEAVRYSYHLWQRDRSGGFALLEQVAACATRGLLPDVNALESVLGLSVVIFFEYYQDRSVSARLQRIWREIIAKLLRIQAEGGRSGEVMRAFVRERLFSLALTVISRILDSFPGYNWVSYKKLKEFFQLGPSEKGLYRNLVRYIDIDAEFPREQMEREYLAAIRINDLLIVSAFDLSLVPRAIRNPLAALPLLRKLFDAAKRDVVAYPSLSDILKVLECILDHDPTIDEVFDFFVSALEISQEIYTNYPHCIRTRHSIAPKAHYLGVYILQQYRRTGTMSNDEWLKIRIEEAFARQNLPFFDLLLTVELPFIALEWQKPQAALETLTMFFKQSLHAPLKKDDKSILEFIVEFLARLRIRYPDDVDDFLEEQQAPEAFRLQVRTSEPAETIGELIGQKAWYFLRDEVILNSPELRSQLIEVFEKAADYKNLRAWLDYFIRRIVNHIYGGEALRQAQE